MSTTPTRYALFVCGQPRTRKARLVHDASLIPAGAALDDGDDLADEGSENDDDGAGQGDTDSDDATDSSADDEGTAGDDGGEGNVRDPEMKKVHDEAKKWRLRCRDLEQQLQDGEGSRADIQILTVEKEFYRLAAQRVTDLAAAFKLADTSLITVADNGTLTGMDKVIDRVLQNYPFLSGDSDDEPTERTTKVPAVPKEGGSPTSSRRSGKSATTSSTLRRKFPALGRMR